MELISRQLVDSELRGSLPRLAHVIMLYLSFDGWRGEVFDRPFIRSELARDEGKRRG